MYKNSLIKFRVFQHIWIFTPIEKNFDKPKETKGTFTFCGIQESNNEEVLK